MLTPADALAGAGGADVGGHIGLSLSVVHWYGAVYGTIESWIRCGFCGRDVGDGFVACVYDGYSLGL